MAHKGYDLTCWSRGNVSSIQLFAIKGNASYLFFNCIFSFVYFALSEDECVYFCKNVWLEFALLRKCKCHLYAKTILF